MTNLRRLSKAMAHALRHKPDRYGLTLDEEGWTAVSDLIAGLNRRAKLGPITRDEIDAVLARPGKRRYEMKGDRIRALYGHSIPMKIKKETAVPPSRLYHGTAPETADLILRQGLKPMKRQYVHLSTDVETAQIVGRRKAHPPTILVVDAAAAHAAGVRFYPSQDEVWLADPVPPTFLTVLE